MKDEMGWPDAPFFEQILSPDKDKISGLHPEWSVRWDEETFSGNSMRHVTASCVVDDGSGGRRKYWYRWFKPYLSPIHAVQRCTWAVAEAICHDPTIVGTTIYPGWESRVLIGDGNEQA